MGGNANRQGQLSIPFRQFHIQSASIQLKRRCFYLFEITNYIIPDEKQINAKAFHFLHHFIQISRLSLSMKDN